MGHPMKMNYFVFGTNNMQAGVAFYDAVFDGAGLNKIPASDRMTYWLGAGFAFTLAIPFDEEPATRGNGTMLGLELGADEDVRRVHAKAVELGGQDEGEPRQRGPKFSAYVRDLDGNKLCLSA